MISESEIAFDLLTCLLAGERGEIPSHLANLLEKSSPLDAGDVHYRWALPPELAGVRLSPDTRDRVVAALCDEISRNPDAMFIAAISRTGMNLATRCVAMLLVNPPRPLSIVESSCALA